MFAKLCSFDLLIPLILTFLKDFGYINRYSNYIKYLIFIKIGFKSLKSIFKSIFYIKNLKFSFTLYNYLL